MRAPAAAELLNVWEDGLGRSMADRALLLLTAVFPEMPQKRLAELTIGQRDTALLGLRQALWGPDMDALETCPVCEERLELSLDTREMLAGSRDVPAGEISLDLAEFSMTFRLPTTADLAALEGEDDPEAARLLLLDRCLSSAQHDGISVGSDALPTDVVDGIVEHMADADPMADIQLMLTCPACAHRWRAAFDIVSFLLKEIEIWAGRILSDVHILARAYGWRERDILNLSLMRRQFYLDMVGS
jgi:hypothetical protein